MVTDEEGDVYVDQGGSFSSPTQVVTGSEDAFVSLACPPHTSCVAIDGEDNAYVYAKGRRSHSRHLAECASANITTRASRHVRPVRDGLDVPTVSGQGLPTSSELPGLHLRAVLRDVAPAVAGGVE